MLALGMAKANYLLTQGGMGSAQTILSEKCLHKGAKHVPNSFARKGAAMIRTWFAHKGRQAVARHGRAPQAKRQGWGQTDSNSTNNNEPARQTHGTEQGRPEKRHGQYQTHLGSTSQTHLPFPGAGCSIRALGSQQAKSTPPDLCLQTIASQLVCLPQIWQAHCATDRAAAEERLQRWVWR